ncbi:ABC transporter ATP-binding protein [Oceanicola sp. 502str15]|uniref:ABC transporter ATP-binding protein n=1 Tax=Oceanicola sp. 502str15 TaxID=2696061 RepID=UPI0020946126|nr:ABC transporter ATP-binding protein [Oceanicola sp. 502str15]MCO6383207.1 dipeptide ABC transporter ATP-binding protein [Oceanicola sp. 502str15]
MIALDGLSLAIHGTPILRDVSLSLAPGRILGLVGESGSGKSMTALSIIGLLPHGAKTTGAALLDGEDLRQASERRLCALRGNEIGMIFQEPMTALNPMKQIGAQVAETLRIHGAASRREAARIARDKLDRVGLKEIPDSRYPHELSGGQRQRVCIAMAIALRPRLLIADEPTTALDVTTQAQILDLLRELVREEGMALLLITHDLAVVAEMADEIAVMKAGEVVEHGPAASLLRARRHPYTRSLFEASGHQPDRAATRITEAPLLTVTGAIREYPTRRGPFRAVNGVSFALRQGESLGLVGESGCGKSTLTRAILGLDPLQGGTIELAGAQVTPEMGFDLRRRVQVVFQDPYGSFNPRHRVGRLVSEPFHLTGRPADLPARIAAALRDVGLSERDAEKYPHEFSGGQRQRIAIARALITHPELIVLDEAVSALDVQVRARILDLLAHLQAERGLSYLFISHDLSVVRNVTDRVLVMKAGEIVEQGETGQVFTAPAHPYTRALISAAPVLAA